MTRFLAALLCASAAVPCGATAQRSPFAPDTLLNPPGGPRIVMLGTPGQGVAALRLAVPLREGPREAGAGQILRALALRRMESLARPVGVRVSVSRTPWGMAYSVEGASADFEYLAYLLREAVSPPDVTSPDFAEARLALQGTAARALEAPGDLLLSRLRAAVAPELPPNQGTLATAEAMDAALVRGVWSRSHQASAMTLVVAAPVVPEVVLAATRGLGAPEADARGPLDAPAPPARRPDAETLRAYFGEAFSSRSLADPHPMVTAILAADHLRAAQGDFEVGLQLWELSDRWVLAVTGRAYPRQATAMRNAVSSALPGTLEGLNADRVARAVARVRRDVMLRARTPQGLVSVVGRAMEAEGDPTAAARLLEALSRVDLTSTRAFLTDLVRAGAVRAEVRP